EHNAAFGTLGCKSLTHVASSAAQIVRERPPRMKLSVHGAWCNDFEEQHDRFIRRRHMWIDCGNTALDRGWLPGGTSPAGAGLGYSSNGVSNNRGFHLWSDGLVDRFHFLWSRISIRHPTKPDC